MKFSFYTIIMACLVLSMQAKSQVAKLPFETKQVGKRSDSFSESTTSMATRNTEKPVVVERVNNPNVQWQQVTFGDYNLGESSYLRIVAKDAAGQRITQILDSAAMKAYGGQSALFDSDTLEIELYAASGEQNIFFEIKDVKTGTPQAGSSEGISTEAESMPASEAESAPVESTEATVEPQVVEEALCQSGVDQRETIVDSRIGRLVPIGCTAWIIGENAFLTAGHCVSSDMTFLQFSVPESAEDGTTRNPRPKDQYFVLQSSIRHSFTGVGDDWAIFSVARNSNTDKLPFEAQGEKFSLKVDPEVAHVAISGFGVDDVPKGSPPPRNRWNQTLQGHQGELLGLVGDENVTYSYKVDTNGGNSGSPIIALDDEGNELGFAIGIHTHGGCSNDADKGNKGTSFLNQKLAETIRTFELANGAFVTP